METLATAELTSVDEITTLHAGNARELFVSRASVPFWDTEPREKSRFFF